jgi:hypothetical protein
MSSTLFPPTYTVSATTWQNSSISNTTANTLINAGGQIELRGDKADVVIDGVSLKETLEGIQDRLNILRPNPELEAEWGKLQELGEQYRKLESELLEKQQMWSTLRK